MNIKDSKTMFVTINEAAALTGLARSYILLSAALQNGCPNTVNGGADKL